MFRFDHVGIAVPDLDAALTVWRDALGAVLGGTEVVESESVRVAFLSTGETATELLEPTSESSAIAKFLASGRKGIHHVAYEVDDIDETLARLREQGIRLIHETAVPGSRGTRIAFVHPAGTGGVLVELVEYPDGKANHGGGH